jgi:ADP-heptose:LPS heptosyltransferase
VTAGPALRVIDLRDAPDVRRGRQRRHAEDDRPLLLSYRALGLGDLLTAVPALRALRRALPHHQHVHAAPAPLAPLLHLIDEVDRHLVAGELAPLPVVAGSVDVAVDLHGRGPQSHRVLQDVLPEQLIAFDQPEATHLGPLWDPDEHEVARWCRLLSAHGIPADPTDLHLVVPSGSVDLRAPGCTLVHPGAASAARRWPAERFAAVARAEAEAGRCVVITGSPAERPLAERVADLAGLDRRVVAAGTTDLLGLARLVAVAQRVVCGDTGVAHLATAVGTPSVLLFGPTSPARWGPPAHLAHRHVVLWAGRTGDAHAAEPDPGLLEVDVASVLAALDRLPAGVGV